MKPCVRSNRPFARSRQASMRGESRCERLASLSGGAGRALVEKLEPRQMLFSLAVTADAVDPNTGLGTVAAIFGYTIPYIGSDAEVGDGEVTSVIEDFAEVGTGLVPNGFEFDESFLRIRHNITPGSDITIIANQGPDGPIEGTERMRTRLSSIGEFFQFEFDAGDDVNADDIDRAAIGASVTFNRSGGLQGLDYNNIRAILSYRGATIATFTGASLRDLNTSTVAGDILAGVGEFTFDSTNPSIGTPFDRIRFEAIGVMTQFFEVDNITARIPPGNFAQLVESRIFGAEIRFTGPVGSSVQILDLYGREMVNTIRLGKPQQIEVVLVDGNDDGVPDFNDGIGSIIIRGADSRTSVVMTGGTLQAQDDPTAGRNPLNPTGGRYQEGTGQNAFVYQRADSLLGIFDAFEDAGFGYAFDSQEGNATGLPPGSGAVVLGSPFVRDNSSAAAYAPASPVGFGGRALFTDPALFNNPNQGVFVTDGSSMGSVRIHGVVHGTSDFTGAVETINIGYLLGSVRVAGDLGGLIVASDAGQWVPDPDFTTNDFSVPQISKTDAEVVIGRTVGEIAIAGRSLVDLTVLGDLDSPTTRPARDVLRYKERELVYPIDEGAQFSEAAYVNLLLTTVGSATNPETGSGMWFGTSSWRNDGILSAEWVNSSSTAVVITGELGFGDPTVNTLEDGGDTFAFAAEAGNLIEVQTSGEVGLRIVDQDGRTMGAIEQLSGARNSQTLRVTPDADGVYYLIVTYFTGFDGNTDDTSTNYEVLLSGIVPTTMGSYRTGGGNGGLQANTANAINVLGGHVGAVRIGTAFIDGAGADVDPQEVFNTATPDPDDLLRFSAGSLTTAGNLYALIAGSDIEGSTTVTVNVNIGGNLGALYTGLSPIAGVGPTEGDIGYFDLRVGGHVGKLDVRGAIGVDQDGGGFFQALGGLNLVTGLAGGTGDIGMIRVGSHVQGGALRVDTPDGAVIGAMLISQDIGTADGAASTGIYGGSIFTSRMIATGLGADVRFVNFPRIDLPNTVNSVINLFVGTTVEITDDSGGKVRVTINGQPSTVPVGFIRFLPIDNSEGVAISTISANLSGNRTLDLVGVGVTGASQAVAIGSIDITDATPASALNITGALEVDVWRVRTLGGTGFNSIINNTPNGDLVAVDVVALNTLAIQTGDLGRTQMPAGAPRLIGPALGFQEGLSGEVGAPLGIAGNTMDTNHNGQLYRPANVYITDDGSAYADDIGGPFDDRLDGLVVRTGNLASVRVGGQIGDVILQGGGAVLTELVANADNITPLGEFDGVVGVVYASIHNIINLGDGLARADQNPIASSGIFADDEIRQITARAGASIRGPIIAANIVGAGQPLEAGGIASIMLTGGGDYIDAYIGVEEFDGFWRSFDYQDDTTVRGDIASITGTGADFFRSTLVATNLATFRLTDGFFDASTMSISNRAGTITAQGFRNSTTTGTNLEFRPASILIGENVTTISAVGTTENDISDMLVDVVGTVTGTISARNFIRADLQVDNELRVLTATGSFTGSNVTTGSLLTLTVGANISASQFTVSGPIGSVTAGANILNTAFRAAGPNGRIDLVQAAQLLTGTFESSGPIGAVISTTSDIDADIRTTTTRGTVQLLQAARDLKIRTDISAGIRTLVAGRNLGDASKGGILLVRGDLTSISIPNGQLYSEIRVGGTVGINIVAPGGGSGGGSGGGGSSATPGVVIGRGSNLAGNDTLGRGSIVAFDRIGSVTVNGDFAGSVVSSSKGIASVVINNGSLLSGGSISAFDGSIDSFVINGGHLLGDAHADYDITSLRVVASANGVFGDIGVNPALSATVSADAFRNQLPLGVIATTDVDGPSITAGRNITSLVVTGGSVFESSIHAGRSIVAMSISGDVTTDSLTPGQGVFITAGDLISGINISGLVKGAFFGAGLFNLGADGLPGGVDAGKNLFADTVRSGAITAITIGGSATDVDVVAGKLPGKDGIYNTVDDRIAIGSSSITTLTVGGAGADVVVAAENLSASILSNSKLIANNGGSIESFSGDPTVVSGAASGVFVPSGSAVSHSGASITVTLVGAGQAFWDSATGRLTLAGTNLTSALTLSSSTGVITNFDVVSTNESSLGLLTVAGDLAGDSDIIIDGSGTTWSLRNVSGTGTIRFGGDVTTLGFTSLTGGFVFGRSAGAVSFTGNFGATSPGTKGEASLNFLNVGSIVAGGSVRALVNVGRDLTSMTVTGALDNAQLRVGSRFGLAAAGTGSGTAALTAGSMRQTRLSAGDELGGVAITGDMFDSAIMVGADLGADGEFGGTGLAADTVSTGFGSAFTIGGNFFESDIIAGALRGADGFFGTSDDSIADGRSSLGAVTIAGSGVGSNRNTESYRIFSTGTLGAVTVAGQAGRDIANFRIVVPGTLPAPIQVNEIRVSESSRVYTARIFFNQPIDASTLAGSLTVREVRGNSGTVEIFLVKDLDYTLSYDSVNNAAVVTFDRTITSRDLPQLSGVPGPGVYRFVLDHEVLRAQLGRALLDGNGNGFAIANDDFTEDAIVGDAGDKLNSTIVNVFNGSTQVHRVDFYGPVNLDVVFDNNRTPDQLPDPNTVYTVRGVIGDHPDNDINYFRFAGDMDVYRMTLQSGQVLRLGDLRGAAINAQVSLISPSGQVIGGFGGDTGQVVNLPVNSPPPTQVNVETAYLILETGVYFIAVGNTVGSINGTAIPTVATAPGNVGDYAFTLEVFDDGDSGFRDVTDAGNGDTLIEAPLPTAFPSNGTTLTSLGYTYTLNIGADGIRNTADDVVTGGNAFGVSSTRAGGVVTTTVASAIGPKGHAGIPGEVYSDVDVFHLNSGNVIAPGTMIQVKIKLAAVGGDLGSRGADLGDDSQFSFQDFISAVQFGVFDTTGSSDLRDAQLVLSPTDFTPNGGRPGTLADNGETSYGFDASGDFFVRFPAPGRIGSTGAVSASYAVYLQGVFNTDYTLEVTTGGTGTLTRGVQNIFIETQGGTIDWLEAGGLTTEIQAFDPRVLGLSGSASNGQAIADYLLQRVVSNVESVFAARGLDVNVSFDSSDFEFEDFSTIFLSSSNDPVSQIFGTFDFFNLATIDNLITQPYGFSQHSDPFNADKSDEAVVLLPAFASLGYTAGQNDIDNLVNSLTAAVGRHAGELMGLRLTTDSGGAFDIFSADAVDNIPESAASYQIPTIDRVLSDSFDSVSNTDFWLGTQNANGLLSKVLS